MLFKKTPKQELKKSIKWYKRYVVNASRLRYIKDADNTVKQNKLVDMFIQLKLMQEEYDAMCGRTLKK